MKKRIILIVVIAILFIGFTIAYFSNKVNVENVFDSHKYSTMTVDNFISPSNWKPGDTVDKTFYVTNNGLDNIVVRLKYSEEWIDSDNNILSNTQNNENVAIINFANDDWVLYNGYYYYKYVLKRNSTTSTFINSVTFNQDIEYFINCDNNDNKKVCKYSIGDYDNATYKLTFNIETVQFEMYKDIWNTDIELINN